MAANVERRVCTIIVRTLKAEPENIRPETLLSAADLGAGLYKLRSIAFFIERDFDIVFPENSCLSWTSVGDIIEATEAAVAADRARSAA